MADTITYSGNASIVASLNAAISGDKTGAQAAALSKVLTFAASGGTAPTLSGFFKGTITAAAGDLLLAHASDPLQGMGDATYSQGFTVAGTKLKFLYIENTDTTNSITISRGTTNGLPIFNAADDAITLAPGDFFLYYKAAGTAALTTGTNDKLTIAVSGGSPTATVIAAYGP